MALATLTIDVNAKLANIERDLGRVSHIAKQNAKRMQEAFDKVNNSLNVLGGLIGAATLTAFVKASISSAAALDDLAESTGASVENLSKLVDIARIGGGNIDTVSTAINALNRSLQNPNADENEGVGAALKAIGLSAEELLRLDPAARIETVARAMAGFADDAGKGSVAYALFRRTAGEVVPFLNDVNENLERGASVTAEQARQAEALEKAFNALAVDASNAGRAIIIDLLAPLTDVVRGMDSATASTKAFGAAGDVLSTVFETVVVLGANVAFVFESIGRGLGGMAAQLGALSRLDFKGLRFLQEEIGADAEEARRKVDAFSDSVINARKNAAERREAEAGFAALSAGLPDKPSINFNPQATPKPPKPRGSGANLLDQQAAAILSLQEKLRAAAGEVTEFDRVMGQLTEGAWKKFDQRTKDTLVSLAKQIDAVKIAEESTKLYAQSVDAIIGPLESQAKALEQQIDAYGKTEAQVQRFIAAQIEEASVIAALNGALPEHVRLLEQTAEARRRLAEASDQLRLQGFLDQTATGQLEKARADMLFLTEAFEKGDITQVQYLEAVQARLGHLVETAEQSFDAMGQFGIQAARNMQSAFADFLFDPFSEGLDGMLQGFGQTLQRMIAEAVAADLGKRLFGDLDKTGKIGGLAGQALDFLSTLFNANGNAFAGTGPVQAFASGGAFGNGSVLTSPTLFRFAQGGAFGLGIAGEAGPEGALPLKRMSNGKLGVFAEGSGGPTIIVNVAPGTPAEVRRAAGAGAREVVGALSRMQRYA